jgi:uncharacterized protein (TIGR02270 family)
MPAVTDIVLKRACELANEAAFLWESRSFVACSSAVTVEALARVDDRLSSIVRSLCKRPELAFRLLQHEPESFPSGHAFVVATVALQSGASEVFEALVMRLESEAGLHAPLASALTWPEYRDVKVYLEWLLGSRFPFAVRLGIAAAVAHRVAPRAALERGLDAEDPQLRGSALEAVGRLGATALRPRLVAALEDEDATCRFWAAWSTVRFGDETGIPVLGSFAAAGGAFTRQACDIVLRALEPDRAVKAHARLLSTTGNERLGLLSAGIIGDPTLADWVLNEMESPSLARPAGAAFCLMMGCDLRRDDLDAALPASKAPETGAEDAAEIEAGPVSFGQNADSCSAEADEDLAWPDTIRLRKWWEGNRHAFVPGTRYLAGMPIRQATLANVLRAGNQQQRAAASLELALLNPDVVMLDVTAPAHQQIGTLTHSSSS